MRPRKFHSTVLAPLALALSLAMPARAEVDTGLDLKPGAAQPLSSRQAADLGFDAGESAAIFVGVRVFLDDEGNPSSTIAEVPYAVDDAVDLASLFVHELNLVKPRSVILALSGEPQKLQSIERLKALEAEGAVVTNARFANILRQVKKAAAAAKERGILLLSFATHGYAMDGDRLLGLDSSLADLDLTGLPVGRIMEIASTSHSPRRLILIDSCRERFGAQRGLSDSNAAMTDGFAHAIAESKGMVILSGATVGGFSYDDPVAMNGVFSSRLMLGLRGEATADERGYITPHTLAQYVDLEIKSWVKANRPDHASMNVGVSFNADDFLSGSMPLAVNPAFLERLRAAADRSVRLPLVLRQHIDYQNIYPALADEVDQALKGADPSRAATILAKLELLEKVGALYAEDFALWWEVRGRAKAAAPAPSVAPPKTVAAAAAPTPHPSVKLAAVGAAARLPEPDRAAGAGRVECCGLTIVSPTASCGSCGAVIAKVAPKSEAEKAGLRANDVIVKVGDESIDSPEEFMRELRQSASPKGDAVRVQVKTGSRVRIVHLRWQD